MRITSLSSVGIRWDSPFMVPGLEAGGQRVPANGGKEGSGCRVQGADGELPSTRTRFAQERGDRSKPDVTGDTDQLTQRWYRERLGVSQMAMVVAILGTYRRGGITDQAVDAVLEGARAGGARTEKIYLIEQRIEFCRNCRMCCQIPGRERGECVHQDDLESGAAESGRRQRGGAGLAGELLQRDGGVSAVYGAAAGLHLLAVGVETGTGDAQEGAGEESGAGGFGRSAPFPHPADDGRSAGAEGGGEDGGGEAGGEAVDRSRGFGARGKAARSGAGEGGSPGEEAGVTEISTISFCPVSEVH
jgi:hypothetical protein